jgi:hypothetical protein
MKAYIIKDKTGYVEHSTIVFADTAGQAKKKGQDELEVDNFINISAKRKTHFDKYNSFEEIPTSELLKDGWLFECSKCLNPIIQTDIDDEKAVIHNNQVYCKNCSTQEDE